PVADRADTFACCSLDDLEHPALAGLGQLLVVLLALEDLLGAHGAAEVLHHRRVAEALLKQRKVTFAPRFETHTRPVKHVAACAHSHAPSLGQAPLLTMQTQTTCNQRGDGRRRPHAGRSARPLTPQYLSDSRDLSIGGSIGLYH